jgi:hypothetical protein
MSKKDEQKKKGGSQFRERGFKPKSLRKSYKIGTLCYGEKYLELGTGQKVRRSAHLERTHDR